MNKLSPTAFNTVLLTPLLMLSAFPSYFCYLFAFLCRVLYRQIISDRHKLSKVGRTNPPPLKCWVLKPLSLTAVCSEIICGAWDHELEYKVRIPAAMLKQTKDDIDLKEGREKRPLCRLTTGGNISTFLLHCWEKYAESTSFIFIAHPRTKGIFKFI